MVSQNVYTQLRIGGKPVTSKDTPPRLARHGPAQLAAHIATPHQPRVMTGAVWCLNWDKSTEKMGDSMDWFKGKSTGKTHI